LLTAVGTHRLRCSSIDRSCVRITAVLTAPAVLRARCKRL
jgi:hypothetical protein